MRLLARASIRDKLIGVILLTSSLSLLVGFGAVLAYDGRALRGELVESTLLMARVVGDGSVSVLAFGDRAEAARILARLQAVPEVESAHLLDSDGSLFASFAREGSPPPALLAAPARLFVGDRLLVAEPIVYQNELYGTLLVSVSTRALDQKLRRHLTVMGAVLAALMLASVLFALRLQRVVSEPILRLAETARWISQAHDYSLRVDKAGDDEVGVLCDGFNDMLREIDKREREREAAVRKTREKSQFLANMSHELRTPLNSIIGFSEILQQRLSGTLAAREAKFLSNIQASGQHLLRLVNDILDLSKVEAGRMEVVAERFAPAQALEAVVSLMKGVAAQRNVTITIDAAPGLPDLEADPIKFKQVLYNLLSNAVKHSPTHASVSVSAHVLALDGSPQAEEALEIQVSDQGAGIAPADQARLFEEFGRTAASVTARVEGTGLGLALVRRFVELHGGRIGVRSAPGQGATFVLVWPLRVKAGAAAEPAAPGATDARPRVLVVEAEARAYEALRAPLLAARLSPAWAREPEEALHLARSLRPLAITLDLSAARPDSWELLRRLKADPQTRPIPVVVVSLHHGGELRLALGADDYIPRPLQEETELLERVRALVPAQSQRSRILAIDDDPRVHELLQARLEPHGFLLEAALSGAAGIARAEADPPALIVLDLMMQGLDGFDVALRLRSGPRTAHVPIVVLTAKRLSEADRARLQGRIDALVEKAEPAEALVAAIERLAGGRGGVAPRPLAS